MQTTQKEKTKKLELVLNGFHGYTRRTIRVPESVKPGDWIELSPSQARRLKIHSADSDCVCGEGFFETVKDGWNTEFNLQIPDGDIIGNYPQR